ncbi:hypothetical protein Tco_0624029 [Tanacetum coccineum]|uniref:Uncharacterized protein n=1 Tax=Tanacetum coccineum TaxID=301880 RepID=A0ABQ4WCW1_9ASTR
MSETDTYLPPIARFVYGNPISQIWRKRSIKEDAKNLLKQQFETLPLIREDLDSAYERMPPILWHVVATMIRGQPGLDELDFDDLYNNLKVYEHELKGVSNSNSQNIAFLSTEIEIISSFIAHKQASMPHNLYDEDLLQIDEDAMEEIDIRWQVAMITARIRKFMRKTGRSIDLKPKKRDTFDKSINLML